jgi:alpha/beta hydrolase fold
MTTRRQLIAAAAAIELGLVAGLTARDIEAQDATPVAVALPKELLPEEWEQAEGEIVEINGAAIYDELYGEGEPLLLLHGGPGNGTHFRNQIPSVSAAGYQLIVMDSRGHGRSSFDDKPIT